MSRKKVAYFFGAVIFIGSALQLGIWWDNRADGFRLHKIESALPSDSRWDIPYSDEMYQEVLQVLRQPFHYFGHGFQCFAFESEDGKYVLKFFRHHRLRLPWVVQELPAIPLFDEWRTTRQIALKRRAECLLRSCRVSQIYAAHECALLFTHLNPTKDLFPTVKIIDKIGNHFAVDLDGCQFMVQRKAVHVKPTLKAVQNDLEAARARIRQIFTLLSECAKRGIQDTDNALIHKNNLGFLEDRAIYIDGGKLALKEKIKQKENFVKDLKRLDPLLKWMERETPQLVPLFNEERQRIIDQFPDAQKS